MFSSFLSSLKRNRKFWLLLPVIVVPFLIIVFALLGGEKGKAETKSATPSGMNTKLPDAHFNKKKDQDKMGLYEAAGVDSLKSKSKSWWNSLTGDSSLANRMSFQNNLPKDITNDSIHLVASANGPLGLPRDSSRSSAEKKEKELEKKLAELNRQLKEPPPGRKEKKVSPVSVDPIPLTAKILRAEEPAPADPEMTQLNQMLDKVMAIQHPELSLDSGKTKPVKQTMDRSVQDKSGNSTITAVIPNRQTVMSGSTICMKLTEAILIDGKSIPSGQLVSGVVTLSNERLKIMIKSIRNGKTILPVNLEGYDLDGLAGVYIPGSLNRDVSKESLDQGMSSLGLTTLDPSVGAQAASAGIQAAKTLLSRKVKLVRVTVPSGYQLILNSTH